MTQNQRPKKYSLSWARLLQRRSRCTKTVLLVSRFAVKRDVRSRMTGMGTFLATVALAVRRSLSFPELSFLGFLNTVWRAHPPCPADVTPIPGNPILLQALIRAGRLR